MIRSTTIHAAKIAALLCGLLLASCATPPPSPGERLHHAEQLAQERAWRALRIDAGAFALTGFTPARIHPADELAIYIEGDGFAWISSEQPSPDPTPLRPIGLQLALAQPDGNAAYLGRPCQYGAADKKPCAQKYWTGSRFAPEIIDASNAAIDVLKERFGARRLTLVGYSGGGAVAALLAARRNDVYRLVTVAGNLDHRAWTSQLRLSPLAGSLNPADFRDALGAVQQWHFVGAQDRVMPASIANAFANGFPRDGKPVIRIIPDYDHQCCWARDWVSLWRSIDGGAPDRAVIGD